MMLNTIRNGPGENHYSSSARYMHVLGRAKNHGRFVNHQTLRYFYQGYSAQANWAAQSTTCRIT
jgi:hypothetical protein